MAVVLTKIFVSPKMVAILNFQSFCKTQKCLYLENRAIWSELNKNLDLLGISNFQNIFVSPNIADILNFFIFCKTQKCLYLENRAR